LVYINKSINLIKLINWGLLPIWRFETKITKKRYLVVFEDSNHNREIVLMSIINFFHAWLGILRPVFLSVFLMEKRFSLVPLRFSNISSDIAIALTIGRRIIMAYFCEAVASYLGHVIWWWHGTSMITLIATNFL